jgi:hypothetical protein
MVSVKFLLGTANGKHCRHDASMVSATNIGR